MVPECFLRLHTNGVYCYVRALYLFSSSYIFTARKRSLGQANVFTPVCHSVYGGVCPTPLDADPLPGLDRPPRRMRTRPELGRPPRMQTPLPGWEDPPRCNPPRGLGRQTQPIRSTSGRYASYWNAYYFYLDLPV